MHELVQGQRGRWFLVVLVLLGGWLRSQGLFDNTFSADEALFASWAQLIATGRDPFLQTQLVDKPPLLFFGQAVVFRFLGVTAWAARLPNWVASLALIPLVWQWVRDWWGDRLAAGVAASVVALSPFAIQFSGTGFTDPLMVTLGVASVVLAQTNRRPSGILFGLAVVTKFQGVLWLPLIVIGQQAYRWGSRRAGGVWVLGAGGVGLGWMVWLFLSGQGFSGTGDALLVSGIRPIYAWELITRFNSWTNDLDTVFGAPIILIMLPVALLLIWRGNWQDRSLLLFVGAYFAAHWLIATPLYDRYMLPLVPILAILAGRAVSTGLAVAPSRTKIAAMLILITAYWLLITGSLAARNGTFDIGGRADADEGSAEVALFFEDAPYGTVLYDHWYSWHWRYLLFDTGAHVEWVATPTGLVENLDVFYDERRFVALPTDARAAPFQRALAAGGYRLVERLQSGEMVLYQIEKSE